MSAEADNSLFFAEPIRRNPGHFLTLADLVVAVAQPGEDRAKLKTTVEHIARQGYLYARNQETEGRKAYLYGAASVVVVEVIRRLYEFGIADAGLCRAVANALYGWKAEDPAIPMSPAAFVLNGCANGDDDWTLEVWSLRNDMGQVCHTARLYKPRAGRGLNLGYDLSEFAMRAVLAIDLGDVVARINPPNTAPVH